MSFRVVGTQIGVDTQVGQEMELVVHFDVADEAL